MDLITLRETTLLWAIVVHASGESSFCANDEERRNSYQAFCSDETYRTRTELMRHLKEGFRTWERISEGM